MIPEFGEVSMDYETKETNLLLDRRRSDRLVFRVIIRDESQKDAKDGENENQIAFLKNNESSFYLS